MSFEIGGRADKSGNRYEDNWVILQMIYVLKEKLYSVTLEPLGDDEQGTDILVKQKNSIHDFQQCKARNAAQEKWNPGDLKRFYPVWKKHLDQNHLNEVSLVSPLSCTYLIDLSARAKNTNGNADTFYNEQIKKSGKNFVEFYHKFCQGMKLDISQKEDIQRSIDYLQRIHYRQYLGETVNGLVKDYIDLMFLSENATVYNVLLNYIKNDAGWGSEISNTILRQYLQNQKLIFRSFVGDNRISTSIKKLNDRFYHSMHPLNGEWLHRKEVEECLQYIDAGESVIITGQAGYGKSGCIHEIIQHCKDNNLCYLAIRLDLNIPSDSLVKWGKDLGFPDSIALCLDSIEKSEPIVIILDQLDSLQWTRSNIHSTLATCTDLIRQIELLNQDRAKKISVVFVCRTFDLNNDRNIRNLFLTDGLTSVENKLQWKKIEVKQFDEGTVKSLMGQEYEKLSSKTKALVKIPSNLEIFMRLDKTSRKNIPDTRTLINVWFRALIRDARDKDISESEIQNLKDVLVANMEKNGRLYASIHLVESKRSTLDYMVSSGLLNITQSKVSFCHQSYYDCFLASKFFNDYEKGTSIEEIIGDRNSQTLNRRYQLQLFMQMLLDDSSENFVQFGKSLRQMDSARSYIKSLFYELLSNIDELDECISNFALEHAIEDEFVNAVVYGRKAYVDLYLKAGILNQWCTIPEKKGDAFTLLMSISSNYSAEEVFFIEQYMFLDEEYDINVLYRFFDYGIEHDTDEFFELRMKFYKHYPVFSKHIYLDLTRLMPKYEYRVASLLAFWNLRFQGEKLSFHIQDVLNSTNEFSVDDYNCILDILLPVVENKDISDFWNGRYWDNNNVYQVSVKFVKYACRKMINDSPDLYWERSSNWRNAKNSVFQEILLDGFSFLPESYGNEIFQYLAENIEERCIVKKNNDSLDSFKKVIDRYSLSCDEISFKNLEEAILSFIPSDSVERYQYRVTYNKTHPHAPIYPSYWGDFQQEILPCLPQKRISDQSKKLIEILNRRLPHTINRYQERNKYEAGVVHSSVDEKNISANAWIGIITNPKLLKKQRNWKPIPNGGFIENTISQFSASFVSVVSQTPDVFLALVLKHRKDVIDEKFYESMLCGIAISKKLQAINVSLLVEGIRQSHYDMSSQEAGYICEIIRHRSDMEWPSDILQTLVDIAIHHEDPQMEYDRADSMNSEDIFFKMKNCVRGKAAMAIGELLQKNKELYSGFEGTICCFSDNDNLILQFASLWMLEPMCHIKNKVIIHKILALYEKDCRFMIFPRTIYIIKYIYKYYSDEVHHILEQGFSSKDVRIIETTGYCMVDLYFTEGVFSKRILNLGTLDNTQKKVILSRVIEWYRFEDYRIEVQNIILKFYTLPFETDAVIARLFSEDNTDLNRDKEFLLKLMRCNISTIVMRSFIECLNKSASSVLDYSDIIFSLCEGIMQRNSMDKSANYYFFNNVLKFLYEFYDETIGSQDAQKKKIAFRCMDLWDRLVERQGNNSRYFARQLDERLG